MVSVLDASAVLALISRETGTEAVLAHLDDAVISSVNLAEVVGKLVDIGMPLPVIDQVLALLDIRTVDFDSPQAREAGALRKATRPAGLSLGDRACLALARLQGARAVTADRRWLDVDSGVPVLAIRS
jgi:PIN domain nuclease of toxin-antitoxin system